MKLNGIRVLDFSRHMAGPLVSCIMADHGADVIKIEPPAGDPTRQGSPRHPDQPFGCSYTALNRGKRSIALDLKNTEDLDKALSLIRQADVLIEAFSPGVADRLGIGHAAAAGLNPNLVYCSITAFGQSGPLKSVAGHDPVIQAAAGTLPRDESGAPVFPAVSLAAFAGAYAALSGILMALYAARAGHGGDYLDLSLHDVALTARPTTALQMLTSPGDPVHDFGAGIAMLQPYRTADEAWLLLGGNELPQARRLFTALGREDLIGAAAGPAGARQPAVRAFLSAEFRTRTLKQWMAWCNEHAIHASPVLELDQALTHEHAAAREMVVHDALGLPHLASPLRFGTQPARPSLAAAALNEHASAWDEWR
ncbi:Formyl-coenzyme A transferase [Pigmentiphaga humi]|uniref:Formyl-coenzyme A transferase n=1 Tax=Pigmentiphaga humi TaxID=2478468 RepID=A0A3P4B6Q1_9BURK|nr:CoA transferase [Pigmentiphaga humi]VCU70855.1 Formyl-coenzyme A transferase [Pigmentiphaga humi]